LKTLLLLKALLLSALLVLSIAGLAQISVRPGITLLLLLGSIHSSKVESAGQVVTERLVQNSPLAGSTSKTDNTIVSHTIELNATADATGATTAYRVDEFTAYKKYSLIPICSRSVHSSKNAELFRLPNLVRATALPNRPRPQTQIVGGSVAVAEHLLRRFLAITLLPDAIVEHAWRTIREPTSSLS
jgi:hypothetical protein